MFWPNKELVRSRPWWLLSFSCILRLDKPLLYLSTAFLLLLVWCMFFSNLNISLFLPFKKIRKEKIFKSAHFSRSVPPTGEKSSKNTTCLFLKMDIMTRVVKGRAWVGSGRDKPLSYHHICGQA